MDQALREIAAERQAAYYNAPEAVAARELSASRGRRSNYHRSAAWASISCPQVSSEAVEEVQNIDITINSIDWDEKQRVFNLRCTEEANEIAIIENQRNLQMAEQERTANNLRLAVRRARDLCEVQHSRNLDMLFERLRELQFETEAEMSLAFSEAAEIHSQCISESINSNSVK
ncbi:MAG: hypothetical protein ACXIVL_02350 [Oceanicaulis sp.]